MVGVAEDGPSPDPGLLVRYLYTPSGEAHAEAGPELRRLLFDNDRTTVDTYEQTVADPATHAAGALLLGLSLPADPATIAAGIALTDDTIGTVLLQGTDYIAVPIPEQPGTLALLPLEGWQRGHSYRVTLTASLADTAGRPLTQPRDLALVIPAEGAVTAAAPPDLAVNYDSVAAASSHLGGRFPGGQTMLFQGLWADPTTGLAYARNRWYDPHNAAWMSGDPVGPVDSSNLYAFVGWGPQMGADPMGLWWGREDWANAAKAFTGSVYGCGKVIASPGVLAYNFVGAYWYQQGMGEQYREQYEAGLAIREGLAAFAERPLDAILGSIKGQVASIERSLKENDAFGAGAGGGELLMQAAMAVDAAKTPPLEIAVNSAPALATTTGAVAQTGVAVAVRAGPTLPNLGFMFAEQVTAETESDEPTGSRGDAEHMHHTIPREVRSSRSTGNSLLPEHLRDHPDVVGRRGNPNRWPVPAGEHVGPGGIHSRSRPGGDFNTRWKEEVRQLEARKPDRTTWTLDDILGMRKRLVEEFGIDRYQPNHR